MRSIPCGAPTIPVSSYWSVNIHNHRMRKKILISALSALVLIVAGLALVIWRAGDLVNRYRPQIQTIASNALGMPVSLGDISLSIIPRPAFYVAAVTVGAPGQTSVSVGSVRADAALLPLLSKRVELSTITIDKPSITLAKESSGVGLKGMPRGDSKPNNPSQTPAPSTGASPIALSIDRIRIHDGVVRLEDSTTNETTEIRDIHVDAGLSLNETRVVIPEGTVSLLAPGKQKLQISLSNISFDQALKKLSLENATLSSDVGSVTLKGEIYPSGGPGTVAITSTGLDMAKAAKVAASFSPSLAQYKPSGSLTLKIAATLSGATLTSLKGPLTCKALSADLPGALQVREVSGDIAIDGSLQDLAASTNNMTLKLQGAPLSVSTATRIRPTEISVSSFTVKGFGGELQAPSQMTLGSTNILHTKPMARALSLDQILQAIKPDVAKVLAGTLSTFDGSFANIQLQNPTQTASGNGSLLVTNARLKGFNIPHQVLSNIDGLPIISGNLRKRVPPDFEPLFASPDTVVREARASFSIGSGVIQISQLALISELFDLRSSGSYGFDGNINLTSEILFSPQFSAALTNRAKEFSLLLNGDNRFTVPFLVKGKVPAVIVLPNVTTLAEKLTVGTVRQTLGGALKGGKGVGKSLGKVLGF